MNVRDKMMFHRWRRGLMEERKEALSRKDTRAIAKLNKSLKMDLEAWVEINQVERRKNAHS